MKLIREERQGSIHFWLEKRHPDYKPISKVQHEIMPQGKTLKQLIDERKLELAEAKKLNDRNNKQPESDRGGNNKQESDREPVQNPKQAGDNSAIHQQPGPGNILDKKDKKKPVVKAKAKRTK
jgi:hypothetical protein